MKYVFCTKFYDGFVLKISTCVIMLGFRKSGHICGKYFVGHSKQQKIFMIFTQNIHLADYGM